MVKVISCGVVPQNMTVLQIKYLKGSFMNIVKPVNELTLNELCVHFAENQKVIESCAKQRLLEKELKKSKALAKSRYNPNRIYLK
jgi:hypothetical protein